MVDVVGVVLSDFRELFSFADSSLFVASPDALQDDVGRINGVTEEVFKGIEKFCGDVISLGDDLGE